MTLALACQVLLIVVLAPLVGAFVVWAAISLFWGCAHAVLRIVTLAGQAIDAISAAAERITSDRSR